MKVFDVKISSLKDFWGICRVFSTIFFRGDPTRDLSNRQSAWSVICTFYINQTFTVTNPGKKYHIKYPYGEKSIPVDVFVFDDGRKEFLVASKDDMFKTIVHRSALYFDSTNNEHFFEEIGEPPVVFSCFTDMRCANFLKGLLYTVAADYDIGLRLLQMRKN